MFGKPDKDPGTGGSDTRQSIGRTERPIETAPEADRGAGRPSGKPSVISADLTVVGNLKSDGDLHVDGTVEGDINSRTLTVGENSKIEGALYAEAVRVCGTVNGQVKATTVTIAKTGKVTGDIIYKTLSIEEGAFVEGHCRRLEAQKAAPESKVSSIKPAQSGAPGQAPGGTPAIG